MVIRFSLYSGGLYLAKLSLGANDLKRPWTVTERINTKARRYGICHNSDRQLACQNLITFKTFEHEEMTS